MPLSRPALAGSVACLLAVLVGLTAWRSGALAADATRGVAWTTVAPQPYKTLEAGGLAVGGRLYSFGGFDGARSGYVPTARSYVYDPATDRWTAIRPLPSFNGVASGVSHAGIASDGSSIYLAGGYSANAGQNGQIFGSHDVYRYDPATDAYTRLPDLPVDRAAGGLAYVGGTLHYFGGTNRERTRDTTEHWALDLADPAAGWVTRAPMLAGRNHIGTAVVGGKIYAAGGQTAHDAASTAKAALESYDPATDRWTALPSIPRALSHTVATVLDGQIVVLGGETAFNATVASAYAYDPATSSWTTLTSLPQPRYSGVVGVIAGKLYYAGGSTTTITYQGTPAATPDPVSRQVSFQPFGATIPSGWSADNGLAYSASRGSGWVRQDSLSAASHVAVDVSAGARRRELLSDQRRDTLIQMQPPAGTAAAWELAAGPASYEVTVAVGDPADLEGRTVLRVEGRTAIAGFSATRKVRFATATVTVPVTDGRLTIDAVGGTDAKLAFVSVQPAR